MKLVKTTIDLPPDLLRSVDEKEIGLSELITRLPLRHLHRIAEKPVMEISADDHSEWRQELL